MKSNCAGTISKKGLNMLMRQILEEHVFYPPLSFKSPALSFSFQPELTICIRSIFKSQNHFCRRSFQPHMHTHTSTIFTPRELQKSNTSCLSRQWKPIGGSYFSKKTASFNNFILYRFVLTVRYWQQL